MGPLAICWGGVRSEGKGANWNSFDHLLEQMIPSSDPKVLQNRAVELRPPVHEFGPVPYAATSRRPFVSTKLGRRYIIVAAASSVICAVLAMIVALLTRPYSASVRLVMHERMFGNSAEVRDFAQLALSPPSLAGMTR